MADPFDGERTSRDSCSLRRLVRAGGLLLPLVFSLGGCGDSGDGPFTGTTDEGPTTSTSGGTGDGQTPRDDAGGEGVNGELAGSLVAANDRARTLDALDLSTGRVRTLPGTDSTIRASGLDRSGVRISLEPDHAAAGGMIATIRGCRSDDSETVCIAVLDGEGRSRSSFAFDSVADAGLVGVAKRSWDGRFFALLDRGANADYDVDLYSSDGRYVSSFTVGGASSAETPYDWLPSGELLVARQSDTSPIKLIRTLPYTTTPNREIELPASYRGEVVEIVTSPTGEEVLVRLDESPDEARSVFVLDLDTLAITIPFTTKPGEPRGGIGDVTWSPDGRWLYLNRFFSTGGSPTEGALRPRTQYAVRVDGLTRVLSTQLDEMIDSGARILVGEDASDRDGRLSPGKVLPDVGVWLD